MQQSFPRGKDEKLPPPEAGRRRRGTMATSCRKQKMFTEKKHPDSIWEAQGAALMKKCARVSCSD